MDFLCLDFINSQCGANSAAAADLVFDDAALRQLCRKWNLPYQDGSVKDSLAELHDTVRQAAREFSKTGAISPGLLDDLNAYLKPVPLQALLLREPGGLHIREIPQASEPALLPYRVVMSFADLACNHEAGRLKICENPDCGWIFYDESKSRTRRWCDNTCASLIKVRRFRKKQSNP